MKPTNLNNRKGEQGFILPLVMIISLIIATGLMALAARSWLGLSGTIRQSQSRQAREIAEAGIARLVESLNRQYSHLLIKDYKPGEDSKWNDNNYTSSICPESAFGEPVTSGDIGAEGKYSLIEYDFQGSPFYGGKASIKMKGERLVSAQKIAATSIVQEIIEIKPKSCSNSFGEPTVTSGFPGLLARDITLGNNDIFGKLSGNVLCTHCYSGNNIDQLSRDELLAEIGANQNNNNCEDPLKTGQGCVAGQIFLGPIDLPPVPTPPLGTIPFSITDTSSKSELTITSNDPRCIRDSSNTTHCEISYISLQGGGAKGNNILNIDTSSGPVNIYITGCNPSKPSCEALSLTGGAAIEHGPTSAAASELAIFGRPSDPNNLSTDQEVNIAGASKANKMWLYFPDGNIAINGGSKGEVACDVETEECTGGDINGAVWAKSWKGSNAEGAQIVVPPDMGTQLFNRFGPQYALGIRDYVALGVSHWSSWTKQ